MSAGTWESHHAITTLMYHYAECVDAADFDGIAALFAHGRITNEGVDGAIEGPDAVRALYTGTNRVHADGTLRTRHLTTNVIVDIDEVSGSADGALGVRRVPANGRAPAPADRGRPLPRHVRTFGQRLAIRPPAHLRRPGRRRPRAPQLRSVGLHGQAVAVRRGRARAPARRVPLPLRRHGRDDRRGRCRRERRRDRRCRGTRRSAPSTRPSTTCAACNGIVLGTPENFGYMAGAIKDFFERIYYPLLDETPGLPYALFVKASTDGDGAVQSVERIVAGLRWKLVVPPVVVVGDVGPADLEQCQELGATIAAGLEAGMFWTLLLVDSGSASPTVGYSCVSLRVRAARRSRRGRRR